MKKLATNIANRDKHPYQGFPAVEISKIGKRRTASPDGERHVSVTITPPNFQTAVFRVKGMVPLVVHRFSKKIADEMLAKQIEGKSASSKKKREPQNIEDSFVQARYISPEGWDGFHAGSIRNA